MIYLCLSISYLLDARSAVVEKTKALMVILAAERNRERGEEGNGSEVTLLITALPSPSVSVLRSLSYFLRLFLLRCLILYLSFYLVVFFSSSLLPSLFFRCLLRLPAFSSSSFWFLSLLLGLLFSVRKLSCVSSFFFCSSGVVLLICLFVLVC